MYQHKTECRICKSKNVELFLDLGMQPLANSFLKQEKGFQTESKFPLAAYFCNDCSLAQLLDVVDKKQMFSDYIYFSSGMPKLSDHFKRYAEDVIDRFLKPDDLVVEIASNDGILMKFFQDSGFKALGIDPAANVVKTAEKIGVETIVDFFSESLAQKLANSKGKAKAILANNVVAHIDDHHDLAKGVSKLLSEEGVFVFEAPYLIDMFENLTYDTIYHEHLSFLSVRPLQKLFSQYGMELFDIQIHPVQGKSIRGFVGKRGRHKIEKSVSDLVSKELEMKLDKFETYLALAERVREQKKKLLEILTELKAKGKKIAAYGAPAKGNTMLNFCGIGAEFLDYALEDLPAKQGLFTPGMHIPTKDSIFAHSHLPDYFLMLAWNYEKPILEKEKAFRDAGGKFIVPVEGVRIV